jgi:hypothetical protein
MVAAAAAVYQFGGEIFKDAMDEWKKGWAENILRTMLD